MKEKFTYLYIALLVLMVGIILIPMGREYIDNRTVTNNESYTFLNASYKFTEEDKNILDQYVIDGKMVFNDDNPLYPYYYSKFNVAYNAGISSYVVTFEEGAIINYSTATTANYVMFETSIYTIYTVFKNGDVNAPFSVASEETQYVEDTKIRLNFRTALFGNYGPFLSVYFINDYVASQYGTVGTFELFIRPYKQVV